MAKKQWFIAAVILFLVITLTVNLSLHGSKCFQITSTASESFKQTTVWKNSTQTKFRPLPGKQRIKTFPLIRLRYQKGCTERQNGNISLSNQILPLTALASPFRSGNTWLRHLLQMATGLGTSSVYCDLQLRSKGYPFECSHERFRQVLVVKTHKSRERTKTGGRDGNIPKPNYDRAILLIRDPYNFIVANLHRGHLDIAKEEDYFKEDWRRQQPRWLNWWDDFNRHWLIKFNGPVYPILYSNLLNDTETEIRKLLDYLRVEFTEADIKCAIDNKEGNFHRKKFVWTRIQDITELFDSSMKARIELNVKEWSAHLEKKYGIKWVDEAHTVRK